MSARRLRSPTLHRRLLGLCLVGASLAAHGAVGMLELPASAVSGPVTVFYPTAAEPAVVSRGPFQLEVAVGSTPSPGSSRLVVISHGSPGTPWTHVELARSLVEAGFTVAMPEHQGDNAKDPSDPGPAAWRRRPVEVSRAIDRLAQEPPFASQLDVSRVGMFGMSAGGHTALVLAGGRWSPSRLREHCHAHIEEDFHACAGPSVALTGGVLDGVKKWVVRAVNDRKFDDAQWYGHVDPRIVAVVAGVPFAADFDPQSLRQPKVALALVEAQNDRWLAPRFHSGAIAVACRTCERLEDALAGGHGALLGPLPPGALPALIADPPGFDRATQVPRINQGITQFFRRMLAQR